MTISSSTSCTKIDAGSGTSLTYHYEIVSYSTGDKFVSASISDAKATYGRALIFKSTQAGADTADINVTYSLSGTSGGFWMFTSVNGTSSLRYRDTGHPKDQYGYTFAALDCTTF